MKRALLFSFLCASIGGSVTIAGCGDDSGSGGATTSTTGSESTVATAMTTTGTQSTSGTTTATGTSTNTTGSMATTAAGMFDCTDPDGNPPDITLTLVTGGFSDPLVVKSAPDNPDRLYVGNQSGTIEIVENGQIVGTFLDISGIIQAGGEEGLLGFAFHPDYANNGRFFVHYTAEDNADSTISEFRRSMNDPLVADPAPVQLALRHYTDEGNHNGGSIEFGSDGYLYIALGDGGAQNDPGCDAQNTQNLLGKISRIDVNATPDANGFPPPATNPEGGAAKYYHIGFRNPFRMSFDVCTGDLYIGDVGQNTWEEISFLDQNGSASNFGWPIREGAHPHNNDCPNDPGGYVEPIAEYDHNDGCSVTGGVVHRSDAAPSLRGYYFYGDYCAGEVIMLRADTNGTVLNGPTASGQGLGQFSISSFGNDGRGNVYVTDIGDGELYRIDPAQ